MDICLFELHVHTKVEIALFGFGCFFFAHLFIDFILWIHENWKRYPKLLKEHKALLASIEEKLPVKCGSNTSAD